MNDLKNSKVETEQINRIEDLVFNELYTKVFSDVLILLEESKNIAKFVNSESDFSNKIRNYCESIINRLLDVLTKQLKVKINYVPLFVHLTEVVDKIELADKDVKLYNYYQHLKLPKEDVINQIVNYGIYTDTMKERKTIVILSK